MKTIDILTEAPITPTALEKSAQPKKEIPSTSSKQSQDATSDAFDKKVAQVAANLGISKSDLLRIMHFETNNTMSPSVRAGNDPKAAVGLIQFTNKTAASLGTTTDALSKMTAVEQLDYVEKYYKQQKLKPGTGFVDLYMMTFMPGVVTKNKPDDFILGIDPTSKRWSEANKNARPFPADELTYATIWKKNPAFHPENPSRDYFTASDVRKVMQGHRYK
jgi:hypothetical protein